jgi:HSP20 family molecular chaperone IbpA
MADTDKVIAKRDQDKLSEIAKGALIPPVDIFEDKDAVTLIADLPGVGKENLQLQIDKDTLQIYGKVTKRSPAQPLSQYAEFPEKDYYRAFTIGEEIDQEKIEATINNGVLRLLLPKHERVKPKKIDIKIT